MKGVPSPGPKLLYKLRYSSPPIIGAFYFMRSVNTAVVQRTWGLHELEARQRSLSSTPSGSATKDKGASSGGVEASLEQVQQLSYGPEFTYNEFLVMPNVFRAILFSSALALGILCLVLFSPVCLITIL